MEPNNDYPYRQGSVAEVVAHLSLWGEVTDDGLARVTYFSEVQRDEAIAGLREHFTEKAIPFHTIEIPRHTPAIEIVRFLVEQLRVLPEGVVSIIWTPDTFPEDTPQADSLRVLNFNRENLALFPLRQIWWMPIDLAELAINTIPDLDRWFLVRLELIPTVRLSSGHRTQATRSTGAFMVPLARNPFFTGREAEIQQLRESLKNQQNVLLTQAISGLGGIGKTQTACEYAYRYSDEYENVLWTQADSVIAIEAGYRSIAQALNLPEKDAPEAETTRNAVKIWLENSQGYLLVFDNADAPEVVQPFLPTKPGGHILLTSRARKFDSLGNVAIVRLDVLSPETATDFLLQRLYGNEVTPDEQIAASELAREVDGLPLALELAAAYIIAKRISIANYLKLFRQRRIELLETTPPVPSDYRETVLTTWKPNFDAVETENPDSAELLRLSAFLAPDAIPFELLQINPDNPELLEPLERYSLINVDDANRAYAIHRLVQEAVKAQLSLETHRLYAEKAIATVTRIYPGHDFVFWTLLDRLLPHQLLCTQYIQQYGLVSETVAELLSQLAGYLQDRGAYSQATPLFERSLQILQSISIPTDNLSIVRGLNNLGGIYQSLARYTEAESLYNQALSTSRKTLPENHPLLAQITNNLASVSKAMGRYADAEQLYLHALRILRRNLPMNHPDIATSLNNLAGVYFEQGRYPEAEPLYKQALEIRRTALPANHPDIAMSLNNLAALYLLQSRFDKAEPLFRQALEIDKIALGENHPDFAINLSNLANLYRIQGRYGEAEPLYLQAINIWRSSVGENHPSLATDLNNLALLYKSQGRNDDAEALYKQSLEIRRSVFPLGHPTIGNSLLNLASLLRSQSRYSEAEALYREAIDISLAGLGPRHPDTVRGLNTYLEMLMEQGRQEEAKSFLAEKPSLRETLQTLLSKPQPSLDMKRK